MCAMLKFGIVGFGYWGPIIFKKLNDINPRLVKTIVDIKTNRLSEVKYKYPEINTTNSLDELLNDKMIDAVIIATPAISHFSIARKCLLKNKHILIEKPMTTSLKEAEYLANLSQQKKKILMVDHTVLYTNAVRKIKTIIKNKRLGNIHYFDATRINFGLFHSDVNVLWDLGAHDVAILNYLIDEKAKSVQAIGTSHTPNSVENIAHLIVHYHSDLMAHFNCSWSSPVKIRNIIISGDKKMIFFNEIEPTEKIKVYDKRYDLKRDKIKNKILINYRIGNVFIPKIEINDAVNDMLSDFLISIKLKKEPISNGKLGMSVVEILELAQKSIKKRGKEIFI